MHALLREVLLGECPGDLAGAVGAEVEADDDVAGGNAGEGLSVFVGHYHCGEKLIRGTCVIVLLHRLHDVCNGLAPPLHHGMVCFGDALPAGIAVHGVKAPDDGS